MNNTTVSKCPQALPLGTLVWSRRLHWSRYTGHDVKGTVWQGTSESLVIKRARSQYKCLGCGRRIPAGVSHAAGDNYYSFGDHYCLGCVTTDRPATVRQVDPPSFEEMNDAPPVDGIAACYPGGATDVQ